MVRLTSTPSVLKTPLAGSALKPAIVQYATGKVVPVRIVKTKAHSRTKAEYRTVGRQCIGKTLRGRGLLGCGGRPTVDERGADSLQATGLVAKMTRVRYRWRSVGHTRQ